MNILKNILSGKDITGNKRIIFNAGLESSIEYSNPTTVISPKVQLLFSPFGIPFVPIEIIGTNTNKILTNLTWTKDRTNPGGILQVTIVPDAKVIEAIVAIFNKLSFNLYSKIWGELGVDLEDLFKPMTLCQLWIDGYHIMTGYVRSCLRSASVANEEKQVGYNVIIEELGNIYNMSPLSYDLIRLDTQQTQISDAISAAVLNTATIKGVTIAQGLKAILNSFTTTSLSNKFTMSDGFPLSYRLQAQENPLGGISKSSLASFMTADTNLFELNSNNGTGSIWGFMQGFIPSPWMEFFTESGGRTMVTDGMQGPSVLFPGMNYIVARTTPYSNPLLGYVNPAYYAQTLLFDLTAIQMVLGGDFVIITDDMISEKTLGFDSINQSTVFRTKYTSKGMTAGIADATDRGIKSTGPVNPFASGGIKTFGIREMVELMDVTNLTSAGLTKSQIERILKNKMGIPGEALSKNQLSNLLAVWFRNQSRFREGPVTIKGMPWARAGMYCLYLPAISGKRVENLRDIGIYYIDSLNHNYAIENEDMGFTTTLNLIRGVPMPTSVAQTALLLFDFEILPPLSGLADGEYKAVI